MKRHRLCKLLGFLSCSIYCMFATFHSCEEEYLLCNLVLLMHIVRFVFRHALDLSRLKIEAICLILD